MNAGCLAIRAGLCSILLTAGLFADSASGQTFETYWVAPGAGNWMVSSNWSDGRPNSLLSAIFNNGGTARLFDLAYARDILMGFNALNSGAIEVMGGSLNAEQLLVGMQGNGSISIRGGYLNSTHNFLGYLAGSSGAVTVDGASSAWNSTRVEVGYQGVGELSIVNGGRVVTTESYIAQVAAESPSTATVDGAGSTWQTSGDLVVGVRGAATLSVDNGALVENANGNIGQFPDSRGAVSVAGAGSWWKAGGVVAVGVQGAGTMTVAGGGRVTSTNGRIGRESNSSGAVTIDGAGSQWNCTGALTVGVSSGAGFSSASLTLRNGGAVSAAGGLSVHGGRLQGDGVVSANITNLWQVAPQGVLQVLGNYTEHSILGQVEIELASAESLSKLAVSGNAAFGGVLRVKLLEGYVPQAGASFDVLDWGSLTGTFSTLSLPALPAPLNWNTSQLYTTGVLSVTAPYLAADFDENGLVDGADLTKWKAGFGTSAGATHMQGNADGDQDVDGADFLAWQRQVGAAPPADAIPEPGLVGILAVGMAAAVATRRRVPRGRSRAPTGCDRTERTRRRSTAPRC
jgi:T5SS/PEP-CTERM-associated repeat protein